MSSLFPASVSLPEIAAYAAVILNIAVYWMRTMVPLRIFAIAVNVLFIVYSSAEHIYPTLILNGEDAKRNHRPHPVDGYIESDRHIGGDFRQAQAGMKQVGHFRAPAIALREKSIRSVRRQPRLISLWEKCGQHGFRDQLCVSLTLENGSRHPVGNCAW